MKLRTALALSAMAAVTAGTANAAVVNVFSEDFTGFDGSGFASAPAAGQLDSDNFRTTGFSSGDGTFGGTHTDGDFARGASSGGVSTGGGYAFDTGGGDISFGVQPGGSDFTPGTIEVRFTYTGAGLDSLQVTFDVWVLNNATRANSFTLTDVEVGVGNNVLGTPVGMTSPEALDGTPAWSVTGLDTGSIATTVNNGDVITLIFEGSDEDGASSRDEFGLDNISVSGNEVPEPGSLALLGLGGLLIARRRRG